MDTKRKAVAVGLGMALAAGVGFGSWLWLAPDGKEPAGGAAAGSQSASARHVGQVETSTESASATEETTPVMEASFGDGPDDLMSLPPDDPLYGKTNQEIWDMWAGEGAGECAPTDAGCPPSEEIQAVASAAMDAARSYVEAYYHQPEGDWDAWLEESAEFATPERHQADIAYRNGEWAATEKSWQRRNADCVGKTFKAAIDVWANPTNTTDHIDVWVGGREQCTMDTDTAEEAYRKKMAWMDKHTDTEVWQVTMVYRDGRWLADGLKRFAENVTIDMLDTSHFGY